MPAAAARPRREKNTGTGRTGLKKPRPPAVKIDPKYRNAARELRDRYLEHVNADPSAVQGKGKYDVSRRIDHRDAEPERRLLAG
jgi:hypothetical protein